MRLGVLGGTFDPIHLGHLLVAEQARDALGLDRVLLIPASRPPHKPGRIITGFDVRLEMMRLAVEGVDGFAVSDLERDPSLPSYTADTLRRLHAESFAEIWLLMGEDSLSELPTWREPEEIARLARIAVYPRPGAAGTAVAHPGSDTHADRAIREPVLLDGPRLRLSSSEIRARVRAGRSIRFLVPEPVRAYIAEHGLYRRDADPGEGG